MGAGRDNLGDSRISAYLDDRMPGAAGADLGARCASGTATTTPSCSSHMPSFDTPVNPLSSRAGPCTGGIRLKRVQSPLLSCLDGSIVDERRRRNAMALVCGLSRDHGPGVFIERGPRRGQRRRQDRVPRAGGCAFGYERFARFRPDLAFNREGVALRMDWLGRQGVEQFSRSARRKTSHGPRDFQRNFSISMMSLLL